MHRWRLLPGIEHGGAGRHGVRVAGGRRHEPLDVVLLLGGGLAEAVRLVEPLLPLSLEAVSLRLAESLRHGFSKLWSVVRVRGGVAGGGGVLRLGLALVVARQVEGSFPALGRRSARVALGRGRHRVGHGGGGARGRLAVAGVAQGAGRGGGGVVLSLQRLHLVRGLDGVGGVWARGGRAGARAGRVGARARGRGARRGQRPRPLGRLGGGLQTEVVRYCEEGGTQQSEITQTSQTIYCIFDSTSFCRIYYPPIYCILI